MRTYLSKRSSAWGSPAIIGLLLGFGLAVIMLTTAPIATAAKTEAPAQAAVGWEQLPEILKLIVPPTFPAKDFDITQSGAVADGKTDCTDAIKKAIDACNGAGGGRVVIPKGDFLTGPIRLKSNVNLFLAEGATLKFDRDPKKYLPVVFTRWEGVECMNYSPFIYAFEQENIAITGKGTLDGQADNTTWWPWKGKPEFGWKEGAPSQESARTKMFEMAEQGIPPEQRVFGEGGYLRPVFVQPYRCKNVLIEGCSFDTGDDCIALKSGRNADGRRLNVPIENVIVRKCRMKDGHGGVVVGSEISGSARNIFAEDCLMDSPILDRVLRLKTNSARGGVIENVFMRNVKVGQVADAIFLVDFYYEEGDSGKFPPTVRNVQMINVTSEKSNYGLSLRGYSYSPITDVLVKDCEFKNVAKGDILENVKNVVLKNVKINDQVHNETVNNVVPKQENEKKKKG